MARAREPRLGALVNGPIVDVRPSQQLARDDLVEWDLVVLEPRLDHLVVSAGPGGMDHDLPPCVEQFKNLPHVLPDGLTRDRSRVLDGPRAMGQGPIKVDRVPQQLAPWRRGLRSEERRVGKEGRYRWAPE